MTGTEMVTNFKLEGASIRALLEELNAHMKLAGLEPEEYEFVVSAGIKYGDPARTVPNERAYRWLVAWAVEGGSEGYYVHVGAMMTRDEWAKGFDVLPGVKIHAKFDDGYMAYMDFGFCKTYSAESAYAICREAQRFLTAARWN